MTYFKPHRDKAGNLTALSTQLTGKHLLASPRLNKACGFTAEERTDLKLHGLLPNQHSSLAEQAKRMYQRYQDKPSNIERYIFLRRVKDENQTLFYYLLQKHFKEMLPIVYTPTIGEAVEKFSHQFMHPQGLHIAYKDRDNIDAMLDHYKDHPIRIAIVTDGEGVLGIGDQGIGGINIAIGKASVYSACAGIDPAHILPIQLDCGTNNETLLKDPAYLGWRHKRLSQKQYDTFIKQVVEKLEAHFPGLFLHWEDFGRSNANRYLNKYQNQLCTFNDDVQGTGAVALSTLMSALHYKDSKVEDQTFIIFGAGTAGIGIANQIHAMLQSTGMHKKQAYDAIWLIDYQGLLTTKIDGLTKEQKPYAKDASQCKGWGNKKTGFISLLDTIRKVKPTVLIGCSAQKGAFTETCVKTMHKTCPYPIILPLSNPTEKAEATYQNLITWTEGEALVATGSPFPDAHFGNRTYAASQCNNLFIFPGIGLGTLAAKAKRITPAMIMTASQTLSDYTAKHYEGQMRLLPDIEEIPKISLDIAKAVALKAWEEGVGQTAPKDIPKAIIEHHWQPKYIPIQHKKR